MPDEYHNRRNDIMQISRGELEMMIDKHCDIRLSGFGIDWQSADGKREFIEDMIFVRRLRRTTGRIHTTGVLTLVATTISTILGLIYLGISGRQ